VYCRGSAPYGADLDLNRLDSIADSLKRRGVLAVGVSGNGETTIVSNWRHYCDQMLDKGLDLSITTNLARELTDEDAATLARFLVVQVSCDVARPELFRKLRRGGDFRTLVYNMGKIRSFALKSGRIGPTFWWNCVVSAQSIRCLEEYVDYGLALGVKHFNFLNLCDPPVAEDGLEPVNHVTEMPIEELRELPRLFDRVFEAIRKRGASYICNTLLDLIHEKLQRVESDSPTQEAALRWSGQPEGMTRNCLDPWIYARICVDAGVKPCCITNETVGFLGEDGALEDILNNPRMQAYRRGILTGELLPACRTCTNRGWIELEKMYLKALLVAPARRLLPRLQKMGMLVPLLHWWRR
jgi:hypothetical protein